MFRVCLLGWATRADLNWTNNTDNGKDGDMGSKAGAIKVAAGRLGISFQEYMERINNDYTCCTICGAWKKNDEFCKDRSRPRGIAKRCKSCSAGITRRKSMRARQSRAEKRDGDYRQARARINADVRLGLRPNPNELYCAKCGHKGEDKRHEYHHVMGYSPEHHNDVLPLCTICHQEETRKWE